MIITAFGKPFIIIPSKHDKGGGSGQKELG